MSNVAADKKPTLSSSLLQSSDLQTQELFKQINAKYGHADTLQNEEGASVGVHVDTSGETPVIKVRVGNSWVVAGGGDSTSAASSSSISRSSRSVSSASSIVAKSPVVFDSGSGVLSLTDDFAAHPARTDNPHSVTKTQVGLGNVTDDAQVKASQLVTSVANPGSDTNVPSEKAVRSAIGALVTGVSSVNTKTGAVSLDADDVGAEPALGNPGADDYILSSKADGTRNWVTPPSGTDSNAKGWKHLLKWGVDLATIAEWNASGATTYGVGELLSAQGGIYMPVTGNEEHQTNLFTQCISVSAETNVSVPVLRNDDYVYMWFIPTSGSTISAGTFAAGAGTGRYLTATLPAGEYTVWLMQNNSSGYAEALIIGNWYTPEITWVAFE